MKKSLLSNMGRQITTQEPLATLEIIVWKFNYCQFYILGFQTFVNILSHPHQKLAALALKICLYYQRVDFVQTAGVNECFVLLIDLISMF